VNIISCIGVALKVFKEDKWITILSMVPVVIGATIYYFLGNYIYGDILNMGRSWIETSVSSNSWSSVLYYLMVGILTIGFYFLLSWTFVLVVSGIASPFNDIVSRRVEKVLAGEIPESISVSLSRMSKNFVGTIVNELKKIALIVILSLLALVISFIPMLAPIGVVISAVLLAVGFLDYSWSRHNMHFRDCVNDIRKHLFSYGIMGGVFLALISIPGINLFLLPFGVVYFTVLFTDRNIGIKNLGLEEKVNLA
jgi:CysZ protein